MSVLGERSESTGDFAALFETIAGQSTITEHQRMDVPVRFDEYGNSRGADDTKRSRNRWVS